VIPDQFRNLGLPDEILELPPVFHPFKANEFSEFSENCWKMSENVYSNNCNNQFFKKRQKEIFIAKNGFFSFYQLF
jgi:hypothetical protein